MQPMAKILLVTNNTGVMSAWQTILPGNGYELDVALSGHEAQGRAASGHPDAILVGPLESDVTLFEQQLRHNEATAAIPIIGIGALDREQVLARIRAALVRRKILIAEDDRQMAAVLAVLLEKSGYSVRAVHDGAEALREVKSWRPDLLVLDVMLPLLDGFHVCQSMNDDLSLDHVPRVIIVSGRASDWDQNLGAACGAEQYIVKPFSNDFFLQKVKETLFN